LIDIHPSRSREQLFTHIVAGSLEAWTRSASESQCDI